MSENRVELKSCPYCGGRAVMKDDRLGRNYAECQQCNARGSAVLSEKTAAEYWNSHTGNSSVAASTLAELKTMMTDALDFAAKAKARAKMAEGMLTECIGAIDKLQRRA
ncbi:MAG: Lar family restriction alleviation protein [Synergistaceae bacterium]|nr:Lar family restriction alleviation protein [Synergistaceae bacterium]